MLGETPSYPLCMLQSLAETERIDAGTVAVDSGGVELLDGRTIQGHLLLIIG